MYLPEVYKSLIEPPVAGWSAQLMWNGFVSAMVGMMIGITASLIIIVALVELTISKYFAIYFGFLFMSTGGILAWRINEAPLVDSDARSRRLHYLFFAGLIVISGLICIFVRASWLAYAPMIVRFVVFGLLGMSIGFAIIFSTIDLINIGFGFCTLSSNRSPVESNAQVTLIIAVAVLMGILFGAMFGSLSVNSEIAYHVKLSLLKQESFSYPISAIIGAAAGFANEYLRNQEEGYIQLKRTEYDAAI